ncbi:MAG: thioredoxin family protein [Verrucomicrobiota bacterium]
MKKLLFTLMVCGGAFALCAADLNWMTDLPAAQKKAKADNKLVFMNFTGSDWCGWCKKMDADVFSKKEFKEYADKKLVMVFVDFPRKPLAAEQKQANEALKSKYEIKGYPTLIVLDAQGEVVHKNVGYQGDVQKWIKTLDAAKKSH